MFVHTQAHEFVAVLTDKLCIQMMDLIQVYNSGAYDGLWSMELMFGKNIARWSQYRSTALFAFVVPALNTVSSPWTGKMILVLTNEPY